MIAQVLILLLATTVSVQLPNGKIIRAEVAASGAERTRGLMDRPSLDAGQGMLFLFPEEAAHQFWMKNTLIPLDIIWLDRDKRVIYVSQNTPPCPVMMMNCPTYGPKLPTSYVLEIGAGLAAKHGIKERTTLAFTIPKDVTAR